MKPEDLKTHWEKWLADKRKKWWNDFTEYQITKKGGKND